jgi:hypothetical protein
LLSNEISSNDKRRPSVLALSEMIWSQLVQIRMLCPHSSVPLKHVARTTTGTLNEPSLLPHDILIFHREIASKIVGYGIWLWGITLRGDTHMNIISPCFNRKHCAEWEQLRAQILTEDHPQEEGGGRFEIDDCDHSTAVEFHLPNPYSELIGARDDRISVFPESIFLLAKMLISLNLENCALASLPVSIGYQIANLRVSVLLLLIQLVSFVLVRQTLMLSDIAEKLLNISHNLLSELPASLLHMSSLEHLDVSYNKLTRLPTHMSKCVGLRILDVSYNQLESVPSDLALQCQNLQTLLLDGNPAITTGRMAS